MKQTNGHSGAYRGEANAGKNRTDNIKAQRGASQARPQGYEGYGNESDSNYNYASYDADRNYSAGQHNQWDNDNFGSGNQQQQYPQQYNDNFRQGRTQRFSPDEYGSNQVEYSHNQDRQDRNNFGYSNASQERNWQNNNSQYGRGYADQQNQHNQHNFGEQGRYVSGAQQPERHVDPDYHQWRNEQIRALDKDYNDWRKERYHKFSSEFDTWRNARTTDRDDNDNANLSEANPSDTAKK